MLKYLFLILLMFSGSASARMCQWVDPESGSTQMSGKPPMWYRSAQQGPRVFVFEKSRIIDDTGVEVSDTERERLRQQAFLQADEDREKARQRLLEAKRLDAALKQKQAANQPEEAPAIVEEFIMEEETEDGEPAAPAAGEEDSTMDQMKKLIADWEKVQTDKARNVLEQPAIDP